MALLTSTWFGLATMFSEGKSLGSVLAKARNQRAQASSTMLISDLNLSELLDNQLARNLLLDYCREILCEEPVLFMLEMRAMRERKKAHDESKDDELFVRLHDMQERYFGTSAPFRVYIPRPLEQELERVFYVATVRVQRKRRAPLPYSRAPVIKKARVVPTMLEHQDSQVSRLQTIWNLLERAYDEVEQWVNVEILPGFKDYPKLSALSNIVRLELKLGVHTKDSPVPTPRDNAASPDPVLTSGLCKPQPTIVEGAEGEEEEDEDEEGRGGRKGQEEPQGGGGMG